MSQTYRIKKTTIGDMNRVCYVVQKKVLWRWHDVFEPWSSVSRPRPDDLQQCKNYIDNNSKTEAERRGITVEYIEYP